MKDIKLATQELNALLDTLPGLGIKIVNKKDAWFKLGQNFTTTLGHTIYVPQDWETYSDLEKLSTVTHELVHISQISKYSIFGFYFLYLFIAFPIGLAYMRYRFEREAYVAGFRKHLEYMPVVRPWLITFGVEQLCGKNYGFAWPFTKSVKKWFEDNI